MIIYNPLTTRMTTTHNPVPRLNVWTSRGWILCPALQWRGPKRRLGGWACRNVRQIVSKSAQVLYGEKRVNLRAGIAQRVGTGLRPGKLRKKALSEDKDGELARGIDEVRRIRKVILLSGSGVASYPRNPHGLILLVC